MGCTAKRAATKKLRHGAPVIRCHSANTRRTVAASQNRLWPCTAAGGGGGGGGGAWGERAAREFFHDRMAGQPIRESQKVVPQAQEDGGRQRLRAARQQGIAEGRKGLPPQALQDFNLVAGELAPKD